MISLLIADAHPVFREGLTRLLSSDYSDFHVVGQASGGKEVVDKAVALKPDVVVMDVLMRNGDGIEATDTLREMLPNIKIVILSMSEDENDLFRAVQAGVSAYLLKTSSVKELAESIRAVANGESVLTPLMASKLMDEFRRQTRMGKKQDMYSLSEREKEILELAAMGSSNKEIADKCFISETTVKAHFRNILTKMDVKNRAGAVALATSRGLLKRLLTADVR